MKYVPVKPGAGGIGACWVVASYGGGHLDLGERFWRNSDRHSTLLRQERAWVLRRRPIFGNHFGKGSLHVKTMLCYEHMEYPRDASLILGPRPTFVVFVPNTSSIRSLL